MRSYFKLISIICILLLGNVSKSQDYLNKEFYLVDSLDSKELRVEDKRIMDSCLNVFHNSDDDSIKITAIYFIVEENWNINVWPKYNKWMYDFVVEKLQEKDNKSNERYLLHQYSSAINNLGFYYSEIGNISVALEYYEKGLALQEEHGFKDGIAASLNNIGVIYKSQGDLPNALKNYLRCLKIESEIGNDKGVGISYNNIGKIYLEQNDNEKALEYFNNGLQTFKKIDDKTGSALCLHNIAGVYLNNKEYELALSSLRKSLSLDTEIGNLYGVANHLNTIGQIYFQKSNLDSALYFYTEALKNREAISDRVGIVSSKISIAEIYFKLEKYNESYKLAKESYQMAKELMFILDIQKSAKILSEVENKLGMIDKAFKHYKEYITMRDSSLNELNTRELYKLEYKFQYEKQKAIDDKEHEKELLLRQGEKKRQKIVSYSIGVVLVMTFLFLIFIYSRLKITRKQKILIEEQKIVVDQINEELGQTNEEIRAQNEAIEVMNKKLRKHNIQVADSINYAQKLQKAILTSEGKFKHYFEKSFIVHQPKDIVSGDFFWIKRMDNYIYFAVADCTGHGVPGAFMSLVCHKLLEDTLLENKFIESDILLTNLESRLIQILSADKKENIVRDGMDISLCVFNRDTSELNFAGAYNSGVLIRNEEIIVLKADSHSIGGEFKKAENQKFNSTKIKIEQGDKIYLHTDGFPDQFGGENFKKYYTQNLYKFLLSNSSLPIETQGEKLKSEFNNWKGNEEQIDDMLVLGVEF